MDLGLSLQPGSTPQLQHTGYLQKKKVETLLPFFLTHFSSEIQFSLSKFLVGKV
jgi:hypothetical protein